MLFCSILLLSGQFTGIAAYIDLGTGSLIIQILVATFIGGLAIIKTPWLKIKAFLARLFGKKNGAK